MLYRSDLVVRNLGQSIVTILPALVGQKISDWFHLLRPLVDFEFSSVSNRGPLLTIVGLIHILPIRP